MKTRIINIYSFHELSEDAKQNAIQEWRELSYRSNEAQYIYDEAHNSIKEFLSIFPVYTSRNSWLEPSFMNTDDNIMELTGLRLRKWFINNAYQYITKGKYIKTIYRESVPGNYTKYPFRKKISEVKNPYMINKGEKYSISLYSWITITTDYPLSGMCYDYDLLNPIYDFIEYKDAKNMDYYTFEDVITECFSSLRRSLKAEEEYIYSDKGIIETIEANEYEFLENGGIA